MSSFIIEKIANSPNQQVSYATFMEWALYDKDYGYYMKDKIKVGKEGDFYTSSTIHPIFAKLFGKVFIEIVEKENLPFWLCEFGAGNGSFAKDVLEEIKMLSPTLFSDMKYIIVESSPFHRECQKEILSSFPNVEIYENIRTLKSFYPKFNGIIFSNELFDAFPVHVIQKEESNLNEIYVTVVNGELKEKIEICTNSQIIHWLDEFGPELAPGQRIEVPIAMNAWIKDIASWINKGLIVTIDYGYTKEEWTMPERMDGSLRGYYQHKLISNPLLYPGDMDLTTHIHIDAVIEIGEKYNLNQVLVQGQDRFLLSAGILNYLQDNFDPNPFSEKSKQNRAIRSLITDGSMSKGFKVILQSKSLLHQNDYSFVQEHNSF